MLSVLTSIALSGLYNIRYALEVRSPVLPCVLLAVCALFSHKAFLSSQDPFSEGSLDTVRVRKDIAEIQRLLQQRARGGPLFDDAFEGARPATGILHVELS